jgi:hypothetical protein
MARDYLDRCIQPPDIHRYYHDLESLFYVICYIFTTSAGPECMFREDLTSIIEKLVIGHWSGFVNGRKEYMGSWKVSHCYSERLFERVIDEFTEYFKEDALKKCMRDLRELIFLKAQSLRTVPYKVLDLRDEDGKIDIKCLNEERREPKEYFRAFKRILQGAYDNLEETKIMAQQQESNKNPCDGQQVLPESAVVVRPQESQYHRETPESSVAGVADKQGVEAPAISADVEKRDSSGPVSELTNSSSSVTSNPNPSKKRNRSSDTQEGESESPPPKRAASDKENVNGGNVSDSKLKLERERC